MFKFENGIVIPESKSAARDMWWLQKATAKDTFRSALECINITTTHYETTDGFRIHHINQPDERRRPRLLKVNGGKNLKKSPAKYGGEEVTADRFPCTDLIMPAKKDAVLTLGVTPKLLIEALQMPSEATFVKLSFFGANKPFIVESYDGTYQAVIAPAQLGR